MGASLTLAEKLMRHLEEKTLCSVQLRFVSFTQIPSSRSDDGVLSSPAWQRDLTLNSFNSAGHFTVSAFSV
ncbi:MAG: hypothetical protein J07HQX50_00218, partial [Haloquadratum sp. J07HQX50]